MAAAPVVLTSEELATREARNVVMVSSEEILPRRIAAYTASKSEISFLFRQPSASSILINQPFLELKLEFTVEGQRDMRTFVSSVRRNLAQKLYGRAMEGLPFQSKCVRTSVVTINGATQTYRNSEYMTPYLRSQVSREAMKKIGNPWNTFATQYDLGGNPHAIQETDLGILSGGDSEQVDLFNMNITLGDSTGLAGVNGATVDDISTVVTMHYQEPLFLGVFGGLSGNDSFPLWSCEQNKSPSLLHVHQCSINLNLLDNWAQNMFGLIGNSGAFGCTVTDVKVATANLCCTYVQPPPKYIASALSSNVTYATYKFLRFKSERCSVSGKCAPAVADGAPLNWTFSSVNFPYMPSVFMIEIAPDYNTKSNHIFASNEALGNKHQMIASKEDRRFGIVQLDLIINTSPDVVPSNGAIQLDNASYINVSYNSKQLYKMYLKNCASVERAPYTYHQWYKYGCTVLISPQDMNGILPSQHIRGNISVQGKVYAYNTMDYAVCVGTTGAAPLATGGDAFPTGKRLEKFDAQITALYSNCYLALDAKSGLVGENVLSEQFGNSLRLAEV